MPIAAPAAPNTNPRTRISHRWPIFGAERHAHADLARALRNEVGHHAKETDGGQENGRAGKHAQQIHVEPRELNESSRRSSSIAPRRGCA